MIDPNDPGTLDLVAACQRPLTNAERQRLFRKRQRELKVTQGTKPVLLDENERQLIEQMRGLKRGIDHDQDPRPFLLTVRDRAYLTSALDYHEYSTYRRFKQEYPTENVRALYVRLSVHPTYPQRSDFPVERERQAWVHEQTTQRLFDDYKQKIAGLERENALLEGERNKAHAAIKTWEERLRNAGLSTDYRAQPGE